MADLERTSAGWQLLIDGCDKRTLTRSTTPVDDHGQGHHRTREVDGTDEKEATEALLNLINNRFGEDE